ncbi:MAG: hypothetical protein M3501_08640 [Actinomycetota bacterium]|nr:hypothetical protein [Actinomycetota bacterium]MDQ3352012.1 hypothetical protein [Actinomycetota bacterium]
MITVRSSRSPARTLGGHELHTDPARRRGELFDLTMANMATSYERLTGGTVEPSLRPYTPFERRLAESAFALGIEVQIEVQEARAWALKRGDTITPLQRRGRRVDATRGDPRPRSRPVA